MNSRAGNGGEVELMGERAALELVDTALSNVLHRKSVTSDEAVQLLHDVHASVADVTVAAEVASVVNDAVVGYRQHQLLDTHRVADALLDIRLVLTRRPSGDERSDFEAALIGG